MLTPRWYQDEAINSIYHYYMNGGKGNPIIALPTASGKSIIPAVFIERVMKQWPNQRFLIVTHVKELIRQNADKIEEVWATAPFGIYSAGLKRRDVINPIIFGGIQSMIKIAQAFGHRDIIFIDECHLVNQEENSLYLKFIAVMKMINPNLKVVGLTATKFRMGQGLLTDDGLFTDIIYDMTDLEGFNKLLAEGFLCPLVPRKTSVELDVSNVGIQKGEFVQSQLQHEVDKAEITWKALQEACYFGQNRQSWLIFASGIEHSDHIAEMLNKLGVECASVHSKQSADYNDSALKAHKELRLRAIASFSKLTTGLDHPAVDLIVDLRPTMSVVLHVQKNGRGMRLFTGKKDCLVLDYAKNTMRLGPVNDPVIPRKKGDKTGEVPIKLCSACGVYHHIKAVKCEVCGTPFEFQVKIKEIASTDELIREPEAVQVETFDVTYVLYNKKEGKNGKSPYLKTTYFCGINGFDEFVFPESSYRKTFVDWWRQRHISEPPHSTDAVINMSSELRRPRRIRVHVNRKWQGRPSPEVLGAEF
jgi:DNA repair protein RadD